MKRDDLIARSLAVVGDPAYEIATLKAEVHRLSAANTRLRAAFRINALRAFGMEHDEIDAALDRIERDPNGDTP